MNIYQTWDAIQAGERLDTTTTVTTVVVPGKLNEWRLDFGSPPRAEEGRAQARDPRLRRGGGRRGNPADGRLFHESFKPPPPRLVAAASPPWEGVKA